MGIVSEKEELFHRYKALSFWVEVSRRYHRKRAQFLFQFDRFSKFIGVLSGSYLLISTFGRDNFIAYGLGFAAALLGLGVLIFRVAEKAAEHLEAMRCFAQLQDKISEIDCYKIAPAQIVAIEKGRREIEMKNFHEIEALAAVCYNEVSRSMGHSSRVKLGWLQEKLAQIGTFQSNINVHA